MKEQFIKDRAYSLYMDMKYQIKPKSNEASRKWLRLALVWAKRNHKPALAAQIKIYLNEIPAAQGSAQLVLNAG